MIRLSEGEFVVSAYYESGRHFAVTNKGILWEKWDRGASSVRVWRMV